MKNCYAEKISVNPSYHNGSLPFPHTVYVVYFHSLSMGFYSHNYLIFS